MKDFQLRTLPILTENSFDILSKKTVSLAGLGGNGGFAFMELVRTGIQKFKLAEPGIFDIPDLNRQFAATRKNIGRKKIEVYEELAKDINPDIELKLYKEGLTVNNIEEFIQGSDIHIRVIDPQYCFDVKSISFDILKKFNVPLFQSAAYGMGTILHNYHPKIYMEKPIPGYKCGRYFLPYKRKNKNIESPIERVHNYFIKENEIPSTATSNSLSGILLASEAILYFLQGTDMVERDPIFMPKFVLFDPFQMRLDIMDIREIKGERIERPNPIVLKY